MNRSSPLGRVLARIAAPLIALAWATALSAPAVAEQDRKETVWVGETCLAPSAPETNYCRLAGLLPSRGVDGADIVWEVVLFHDDVWRVQLQAFSEGVQECQYPIKAKGSIQTPDGGGSGFVTDSGLLVGLTFADQPSLGLQLEKVRIDTRGTCG